MYAHMYVHMYAVSVCIVISSQVSQIFRIYLLVARFLFGRLYNIYIEHQWVARVAAQIHHKNYTYIQLLLTSIVHIHIFYICIYILYLFISSYTQLYLKRDIKPFKFSKPLHRQLQ